MQVRSLIQPAFCRFTGLAGRVVFVRWLLTIVQLTARPRLDDDWFALNAGHCGLLADSRKADVSP
jgi:hypothetical protein